MKPRTKVTRSNSMTVAFAIAYGVGPERLENMEKYGVSTDDSLKKQGSGDGPVCPECGSRLISENPDVCPKCGSKPMEKAPDGDTEE